MKMQAAVANFHFGAISLNALMLGSGTVGSSDAILMMLLSVVLISVCASGVMTPSNDLAVLLRAGALPAPLNILEERTIGPGLGADSINSGTIATIIGMLLVLTFIFLSYGRFGLYANIALTLNLVFIVGVLSLIQATLTLPGIAGIVLTIGMAVDANVIIFERIREEYDGGKTPFSAVEAGYSRAFRTILDANITTLIASLILIFLGTGPVKGFAVTLSIGVITSFFTAFVITRLIVANWLLKRKPEELPI